MSGVKGSCTKGLSDQLLEIQTPVVPIKVVRSAECQLGLNTKVTFPSLRVLVCHGQVVCVPPNKTSLVSGLVVVDAV